jgi:hypothetical protein
MSLSTKDVKTGGDFTPKNIVPGNVKAKIFKVELDQPEFLEEKDGYFLLLHLETEKPHEDFVGFHTDWQDENSPTFDGQTGKVKASKWAYQDSETKKGVKIERDMEMMKFLKNLCEAAGEKSIAWWNKVDKKFETIEDLVEAFNKAKPFDGVWVNWCIGGRQYTKQNGYKGWDLHLPKFSADGVPFESVDAINKRILTFDKDDHTEISKPKPVDEFGDGADLAADGDDGGLPPMADSPEFEL